MKCLDAPSVTREVDLPAVCAKLHDELAALHEVGHVLVAERLADELRPPCEVTPAFFQRGQTLRRQLIQKSAQLGLWEGTDPSAEAAEKVSLG